MGYTFKGYLREDGLAGTRNHIGIVSSVICSSVITNEIADKVPGAIPITHANGCAQLGDDFQVTKNMLAGIVENPNFHSALLIGLGCETNQVAGLLKSISTTKPLEGFSIQQMAGGKNTAERGITTALTWSKEAKQSSRTELPASLLKVGIVTEDIDEASLQVIAPVINALIELLITSGATVVFGLTKTLEPAGNLLALNTQDASAKKNLTYIGEALSRRRWEKAQGYLRTNFSEQEKSLAALEYQLINTHEIQSLLDYNQKPAKNGLHLIKTSGSIVETLSNFASVGRNLSIILSKRGILTGSNALPCMIVTANNGINHTNNLVDYEIQENQISQQAQALFTQLIEVSSGKLTKLEEYELGEFAIPHIGTTF